MSGRTPQRGKSQKSILSFFNKTPNKKTQVKCENKAEVKTEKKGFSLYRHLIHHFFIITFT